MPKNKKSNTNVANTANTTNNNRSYFSVLTDNLNKSDTKEPVVSEPVLNRKFHFGGKYVKQSSLTFKKDLSREVFDAMVDLTGTSVVDDEGNEINQFVLTVEALFVYYSVIKERVESVLDLAEVIAVIEQTYDAEFKRFAKMESAKKMSYGQLKAGLQVGTYITIKAGFGQMCGAVIRTVKEETFQDGATSIKYLAMTVYSKKFDGKGYNDHGENKYVVSFKDELPLEELEILPMTPTEMNALHKRGKIFEKYANSDKHYYQHYTGNMLVKVWWFFTQTPATGRIIIDFSTHQHLNPNEYQNQYYGGSNILRGKLAHKDYCTLPNTLPAFSFENKKWGQVFMNNISDIEFNDGCYDKLVMDPNKKKILKSLILSTKDSFTDIVKGKSGGCIFLLHGVPGTGKTLTAETISETLHMPLYSITSGELGTDVVTVEQKLSQILDIAQRWNAIILIDEADVFLEKRDTQNLARNSIVCVFLRLLEKYNGIMFLTTNRKTDIDHAFQSRISLQLEYTALSESEKLRVWQNLLDAAKINIAHEELVKYSKYNLNGRNIKNIIRLAHTLSINEHVPTNPSHFEVIFDLYKNEYNIEKV